MPNPTSRKVWAYRPAPTPTPPLLVPIEIGDQLNAGAFGGTATICRIKSQPYHHHAAKLFLPETLAARQTADAHAKLTVLAASAESLVRGVVRNGRILPSWSYVAWPVALLYDANAAKPEHLIGFVMPLFADALPLTKLTSAKQRKQQFPGLPGHGLLAASQTIAQAVAHLHGPSGSNGFCIGDLTPRNVMITPGLQCRLTDADSYQIESHTAVFRATDTTPAYRSPRMATAAAAGQGFPQVTPDDDAFCLAVILFQVLVDGAHPFAAGERFEVSGIKPDEEANMLAKRFPYAQPDQMFPPKIRLQTYQKLPTSIRAAFEQVFQRGVVVSAADWVTRLHLAVCQEIAAMTTRAA